MKLFILLFSLLLPINVSVAGESVQLDKDYSFRLEDTMPNAPVTTPPLANQARPESVDPAPLKTPEGRALPPGTRTYQFNGQPYYVIPLSA